VIKQIGQNSFELTTDAATGLRVARLVIYGCPQGQGALSPGKYGAYYSNASELEPWRDAIKATAQMGTGLHLPVAPERRRRAKGAPPLPKLKGPRGMCLACNQKRVEHGLFAGGVDLRAVVTLARQSGDEDSPWPIKHTYGDWDHFGRSAGDSIIGTVIRDDCKVREGGAVKTFPAPRGHHPEALQRPGMVLTVWELAA
jgi:hypothetical protein